MPTFLRDGIAFHYREAGEGAAFVFQHGLGGDTNQIFDLFTPPPGIRLITLDCRAHGVTQPVGDETSLRFDTFADDVTALLDELRIEHAVVGGISMGAGVALNLALRHPRRISGLVLLRPAWLDQALPSHLLVYPALAFLLRTVGASTGRQRFAESGAYAQVLAESPDAAASLLGQFDALQAVERVARLERIPLDSPCTTLAACRTLAMPVLVLANHQDPIHPFALALRLAASFQAAHFVEVTGKSMSRERHRNDVQVTLEHFLKSCDFEKPSF